MQVIKVIAEIAKILKLEQLIEKGILAYLSYKQGQNSEKLKEATSALDSVSKADKAVYNYHTDPEYMSKIKSKYGRRNVK
jgi:mannitol-specific phosphotransferase system IIBC component